MEKHKRRCKCGKFIPKYKRITICNNCTLGMQTYESGIFPLIDALTGHKKSSYGIMKAIQKPLLS
jgi:hypothetical protein